LHDQASQQLASTLMTLKLLGEAMLLAEVYRLSSGVETALYRIAQEALA
jgi:signal transduction histidine kinase